MSCEYCPQVHTYEPCAICGHAAHIHERCKVIEPGESRKCWCCCYMTDEQARQNDDDLGEWVNAQEQESARWRTRFSEFRDQASSIWPW